ncbi:MAG: hypothetical protein VX705_09590, partial [Verrucomicrobiota bacterium]|nr:hypothetical protein [Verrucomicrobiota bacterium]
MKQKLPAIAIALSVTTLIMGILLVNNHHKAQKAIQLKGGQINRLTTEKDDLTKDKAVVEDKLEAKETANQDLEGQLGIQKQKFTDATNQVVNLTKDLAAANTELDELTKDYLSATNEVTQLTKKLEDADAALGKAHKDFEDLTKNYTKATNTLAEVTKVADDRATEIDAVEKKLADTEGKVKGLQEQIEEKETAIKAKEEALTAATADKEFLLAELDRLRDDKAKLEEQLNDVETLKAQLKAIQSKIAQAQRLDWIARGVYDFHKYRGYKRQKAMAEVAERRRLAALGGAPSGGGDGEAEKPAEEKITSFELKSTGTIIINGKEYKPGESQPAPEDAPPADETTPPEDGITPEPAPTTPEPAPTTPEPAPTTPEPAPTT